MRGPVRRAGQQALRGRRGGLAQVRDRLGQQLRIEQGAVQVAAVGDAQALEHVVERVGQARPARPGQAQAAGDRAALGQGAGDCAPRSTARCGCT